MRTGELAEQAGVHVDTLRYYERRGLLEAPERSPSGYRSYSPDAVRVVRFVKRAQEVGFTLDDVAELLDLADGGAESCDVARATAVIRREDLDRRIADLTAMRGALDSLVETCEEPRARRTCPLVDSLNQDAAEATGS
jgi:MerR family transcriptional regulator, mercuric resistance operon regulatory protein